MRQSEGERKRGPKSKWDDPERLYEIFGGRDNFLDLIERLSLMGNQGAQYAAILRARHRGETFGEIAFALNNKEPSVVNLEHRAFEKLAELYEEGDTVLSVQWHHTRGRMKWDDPRRVFAEYGGEANFWRLVERLGSLPMPWHEWGKQLAEVFRFLGQGESYESALAHFLIHERTLKKREQEGLDALRSLAAGEDVIPPKIQETYGDLISRCGGVDNFLRLVDKLESRGDWYERRAKIVRARLKGDVRTMIGIEMGGITKEAVRLQEEKAIRELNEMLGKS